MSKAALTVYAHETGMTRGKAEQRTIIISPVRVLTRAVFMSAKSFKELPFHLNLAYAGN